MAGVFDSGASKGLGLVESREGTTWFELLYSSTNKATDLEMRSTSGKSCAGSCAEEKDFV